MAPLTSAKGSESGTARVVGSGLSGVAELIIFHPVDTVAKRLMSNKSKFTLQAANSIIFKDYATASLPKKLFSLFPGLG
ncbi:hypothetical protein FS842_000333, partial [Serendipita sp. 407]